MNLTLALLQTTRPLTAAELHERIPGYPDGEAAFRRAFERDKESLRGMGVPLTMTDVPFTDPPIEGYRIKEDDYYLRDPGFAPDELAALHLAASAVRLDSGQGVEALWKLGGGVEGADALLPAPDPGDNALVELPDDPNLGPLFGAAVDRRRADFTYRGAPRSIDVRRLDFRRGRWYVTGFDHDRDAERNFRVDRIDDSVRTGPAGAFERPVSAAPGGPAEAWQFAEEQPVTAQLLVDRDHAPWVRRNLGGTATIQDRPDGSLVADIVVTNRPAFRSFVLTFLEHAEILAPSDLRADMVAWLEAIARVPTP